jgi:16S rRNA (guanine527-N7)-methyltransferase
MDELAAREAIQRDFDVPRETMARLDAFVDLLRDENQRQNLVSKPSLDAVWTRHIRDSAQLLRFAPSPHASWIDLGTGAGFPGLIVAALHKGPATLVEERRLRVEFLHRAAETLGVANRIEIVAGRVERIERRAFDVISARAFAPLPRIFELAERFSTNKTLWILPKGRNASAELEAAESSWQGEFRLEPSMTDAEASILLARGVKRKKA